MGLLTQQHAQGFRGRDGLDDCRAPGLAGHRPQRRTTGRLIRRAVAKIEYDVRRRINVGRLEDKSRVGGRQPGRNAGHLQGAEPGGRKVRRAKRRLAVQEDGSGADPLLARAADRGQQDLARITLDPGGIEGQSRISSTDSTLTPLSRR